MPSFLVTQCPKQKYRSGMVFLIMPVEAKNKSDALRIYSESEKEKPEYNRPEVILITDKQLIRV